MYSEPKRIEYLDSLRGIASLCVLLSHTVATFVWPDSYSRFLNLPFLHILWDGPAAVVMFFVLSGYVLSKPYVVVTADAPPRRMFLPTFYLRRFTRIWLPWFAVFLMSIVAKKYLFDVPSSQPPVSGWFKNMWQAPLTLGDFLRQCTFTLHDSHRLLLSQDWSLGIELKGSALMPLFIFLSDRKRLPILLAVIAFFLALIHNGHYYISFIIGVLIARYEDSCPAWFQQLNPFARALILIFCLALYQVFNVLVNDYGSTPVHYKYGWLATAIGCGGILLLVRFGRSLQQFLNSRPLVFLGRVSYSVYLLQMITVLCLLPQLVRGMNHLGVTSDPVIFLAVILVSVVTTIACAAATYEIIEVPAINTGHYLTKKIQRVFGR